MPHQALTWVWPNSLDRNTPPNECIYSWTHDLACIIRHCCYTLVNYGSWHADYQAKLECDWFLRGCLYHVQSLRSPVFWGNKFSEKLVVMRHFCQDQRSRAPTWMWIHALMNNILPVYLLWTTPAIVKTLPNVFSSAQWERGRAASVRMYGNLTYI